MLHTGSTPVGHLSDVFPLPRKYTGTTPLGLLCFTQQVHRYGTFTLRVSLLHRGSTQVRPLRLSLLHTGNTQVRHPASLLHTGSTQVRHLSGFFASYGKYTGTTLLGFLCFTQQVHRYDSQPRYGSSPRDVGPRSSLSTRNDSGTVQSGVAPQQSQQRQ